MNGSDRVGAEQPADLEAVALGHHHVEQDQVRQVGQRRVEGLLAVGGGHDLVALADQPGPQDVEARRAVVGDQDARRVSQCARPT